MILSRIAAGISAAALTICSAAIVSAQGYPTKPIRIVAHGAGGAGDITARMVAKGLSGSLRQEVIVDNRGTGVIPGGIVARAAPDGYTVLVAGTVIWLTQFMQDNPPFLPFRDFSPISLLVTTPNILVVHPSLPVKTVKEFVALAKRRPGDLNYASTGTGSSLHLAGALFESMTGVNMVRISYRRSAEAFTDLMSGRVQVMFPTAPPALPHIKTGKMKALAIGTAEPSALAPGLITMAAAGLPGYAAESILGMFAPAGTPAPVITTLNQEIVRFLSEPGVKNRLLNAGLEMVGSTPDQFAEKIKDEMKRMGKVIKEAGIRTD